MIQVKKGDTIQIHYRGTLGDGTPFDSSEGREPLEFQVGAGLVIPGFDAAVLDMKVGDRKSVRIPTKEAYGERKEELRMEFPLGRLPSGLKPEKGMQLQLKNPEGQLWTAVVDSVGPETVLLDANHPLAGRDLDFDLELVQIC